MLDSSQPTLDELTMLNFSKVQASIHYEALNVQPEPNTQTPAKSHMKGK